jgi:hypothetical protein
MSRVKVEITKLKLNADREKWRDNEILSASSKE